MRARSKKVSWAHGDLKPIDQDAWQQARERRTDEHRELTYAVAVRAEASGLKCAETGYIDLWVDDSALIEVKTISNDDVSQSRAALAQLLHYRHIYRKELPAHALLVAIFSRKPTGPTDDLVEFLSKNGVLSAWLANGEFFGVEGIKSEIAWLCAAEDGS